MYDYGISFFGFACRFDKIFVFLHPQYTNNEWIMKRKRYLTANKLHFFFVLALAVLVASCGGKKHHSDDEDLDDEDEEEVSADPSEDISEGAALFNLFYGINTCADDAYAEEMLTKKGFRLEDKMLYDEELGKYVYTFVHPEYGKAEVGWQGAVGYGVLFTTESRPLLQQMSDQADRSGFRLDDGSDYIYTDGATFLWKNLDGIWMYGR